MSYCCEMMQQDITMTCDKHDRRNCPDSVIGRFKDGGWGIYIKDGGSSMYIIKFCPWCGKELKNDVA